MTSVTGIWFLLPGGKYVGPDDPQYEGIKTAFVHGAPFLAIAPLEV